MSPRTAMTPWAAPVLLCLDLQEGDDNLGPRQQRALAESIRLLAHARRRGWDVVHIHSRGRPGPGGGHSPSLRGAEPRALEPVYRRAGLSAFASKDFARRIADNESEIVLAGFALGAAGLATAFAALDRDLWVTVAEEAVAPPPGDGGAGAEDPDTAETVLLGMLASAARVVRVNTLLSEASAVSAFASANER